ncbi:MAG TPA: hypothetical protein VIM30_10030 [Candidatus Limnocylindrales bacterium]
MNAARLSPRLTAALALGLGLAAIGAAMIAGGAGHALDAIAAPPAIVRAFLAAVAVVLGLRLLGMALQRIEEARTAGTGTVPSGAESDLDLAAMVRGIRFVFLAAAAFAAAAGWVLGHPLPIVIAAVIAGVDIVETSFLLLVASARQTRRVED